MDGITRSTNRFGKKTRGACRAPSRSLYDCPDKTWCPAVLSRPGQSTIVQGDRVTDEELRTEMNPGPGEDIGIVNTSLFPVAKRLKEDYWLFDAETDSPSVLFMQYNSDGSPLRMELSTFPETIARCVAERDLVLQLAVPLNDFINNLKMTV